MLRLLTPAICRPRPEATITRPPAAAVRTCVVRRRRLPARELVRLCVRDGVIHLSESTDDRRRGAWVTPDRESLERLQQQPQLAWRTLRVKKVPAGALLDEARARSLDAAAASARRCWRSGLLRSTPEGGSRDQRAIQLVPRGDASDLVTKADRAVFRLSVDRATLRSWLGRCPPLLELRPGRPARRLLAMLRRIEALG